MELEQLDEVGGRARLKPVAAELKGNEGFILNILYICRKRIIIFLSRDVP